MARRLKLSGVETRWDSKRKRYAKHRRYWDSVTKKMIWISSDDVFKGKES